MNEPNAKDWAEFKQHADKFNAARRAFEGFPAERLGAVQEGDFLKLILHLQFYAWGDGKLPDDELTSDLLARLQPERED